MQAADRPRRVVLVVEDEWLIREEIVTELRAAGWMTLEADSAEAAFEVLLAKIPIDLLVTDINLRGPLTGWDVADAYREERASVPVIYASGTTDDRSRKVDASLFLTKPILAADIVDACRRLLND